MLRRKYALAVAALWLVGCSGSSEPAVPGPDTVSVLGLVGEYDLGVTVADTCSLSIGDNSRVDAMLYTYYTELLSNNFALRPIAKASGLGGGYADTVITTPMGKILKVPLAEFGYPVIDGRLWIAPHSPGVDTAGTNAVKYHISATDEYVEYRYTDRTPVPYISGGELFAYCEATAIARVYYDVSRVSNCDSTAGYYLHIRLMPTITIKTDSPLFIAITSDTVTYKSPYDRMRLFMANNHLLENTVHRLRR